ncbi:MAG: crossover junction endodeoxyribonuclease RuvC [Bacteroidales bacterium]|nr:crossover junction endodeoxyribonuclease RuvC [Bacteroidales bacterium]
MNNERIILGIDPGTNIMGYGLILQQNKSISLITMGVLKLSKYENQAIKLKKIFERTTSLIEEFHPDEMAIEAPFFGKNVQSMLKLGRAQGVGIAAALSREVPIQEYAPRKIKQSITGNGAASKEQVFAMLQTILKIKETPEYLDASDAVAVALCHYFQSEITIPKNVSKVKQNSGKASSWKNYITENPSRIVK